MRHRLGPLLALAVLLTTLSPVAARAATVSVTTSSSTATGLARGTTNTDDGTSWATSVPAFQTPSDATDNEPLLIAGGLLLAVLVIAGVAALIRLRARGDDESR